MLYALLLVLHTRLGVFGGASSLRDSVRLGALRVRRFGSFGVQITNR